MLIHDEMLVMFSNLDGAFLVVFIGSIAHSVYARFLVLGLDSRVCPSLVLVTPIQCLHSAMKGYFERKRFL